MFMPPEKIGLKTNLSTPKTESYPIVANHKPIAPEKSPLIIELESNIERQKDKNIRLLAEFDNYKRRTRDEKIHLIRYSGEEIVLSLLPALDDLQRTVDNADKTDEKSIKEAIKLVQLKLIKNLKDKNIESFETIGETFDPELHEALMSEPGEEDDIIVKEFEGGYKYHDRIIRHAKVVVSKIS